MSVPLQPSAPVSFTSHSLIAFLVCAFHHLLPRATCLPVYLNMLTGHVGGAEKRRGGWEEVYGVSRECLCVIVCTLYIRASPETHLVHLTLFTSWCTRHGGLRGPLVSPEDWHVIKPCACMCVYGPWRVCSEGLGYHCMFSVHV